MNRLKVLLQHKILLTAVLQYTQTARLDIIKPQVAIIITRLAGSTRFNFCAT